ncbi:carbon-nitrogen hydrolase family protein [Streptomyces marianii]|uniref:Carbon-nitrogen hydrolase family protein n=1 Tax=Streptomyces marianii TaxID=1817406 RepID=A0A5R9EA91_9ACTN|nr:carbon-nitrogen hydrolase family protein [Streptomyces marianii]TLQ46147.1 carbon-nitrogen hydrolase family protein [Streptomyces marianii]
MIVAAAQFVPVPGDVPANVRTMAGLVRAAAARGARLVVFGELAVTGYELGLLAAGPRLWTAPGDARLAPVRRACRATATAAVVNCAAPADGGRPAVASLVFGPEGELLARYDKRHLHGAENDLFAAGPADGRFTLDGIRFALAVCYDNRFPEVAGRARADGCRVYLASSALDEGNDSFATVYPARARDNGLHVVLGNLVGPSTEAGVCAGGSAVWGPDGVRLATAGGDAPGLAVADVGTPSALARPAGAGGPSPSDPARRARTR